MKLLEINVCSGCKSTGRIASDIAGLFVQQNGNEAVIAYGRGYVDRGIKTYKICDKNVVRLDALKSRVFDNAGFNSKSATVRFIEWVKEYDPDIIHLHNIHGYYINVEILFRYLKTCGKKVIWTLHDCWPFTGHCAYFDYVGCERWRDGCHDCPQKKEYPASVVLDRSRKNYEQKKALFTGVPNMTLVAVSEWLAGLAAQSFLGGYPIVTIQNGIDHSVFKPTESDILEQYGLSGKRVVLGVASVWSPRKGLHHFLKLSEMLSDEYRIVLIGLSESQISALPPNILGIRATNSIEELARWYTAAYVFVNPSVEETFGLVTVEAMACGTPVIVFNRTAVPEVVNEECGVVCAENDAETIKRELDRFKEYDSEACIAASKRYVKDTQYGKYIDLMLT